MNQPWIRKSLFVALAISALTLSACSTTTKSEEQILTKKIQAQPVADTPEQIADRAAEAFSSAPGLTEEQRQKLMAIYSHTYAESMSIRKEIGQSKSLLFKTISTADYKSSEVKSMKKRITELDQKRLALMFKALEDVQTVVGRGSDKENIYRHLHNFETSHGRALSDAN